MTATADTRTGAGAMDLDRLDRFMAKALTGDEAAPVQRTRLTGGLSQMTAIYRHCGRTARAAPDAEQLVVRVAPTYGPLEPYHPVVEATLMTDGGCVGHPRAGGRPDRGDRERHRAPVLCDPVRVRRLDRRGRVRA